MLDVVYAAYFLLICLLFIVVCAVFIIDWLVFVGKCSMCSGAVFSVQIYNGQWDSVCEQATLWQTRLQTALLEVSTS